MIFPNLFIAEIQVFNIQPVAVDECVQYSTAVQFAGAPELNRRMVSQCVGSVGPAGMLLADDTEMYERNQGGIEALTPEWLDVRRGIEPRTIDDNGFTIGTATDETACAASGALQDVDGAHREPPGIGRASTLTVEQFLYREARPPTKATTTHGRHCGPTTHCTGCRSGDDIDPTPMSVVYDNRNRISTRLKQLRTGKRYAQAPQSNTRRLIINIEFLGGSNNPGGDIDLEVGANFLLIDSRPAATGCGAGGSPTASVATTEDLGLQEGRARRQRQAHPHHRIHHLMDRAQPSSATNSPRSQFDSTGQEFAAATGRRPTHRAGALLGRTRTRNAGLATRGTPHRTDGPVTRPVAGRGPAVTTSLDIEARRDALRRRYPVWQPRTLADWLDDCVQRHGERPMVLTDARELSYRDVADQSRCFADGLVALGVQPGDRVGMIMANYPEFVPVKFAIARTGAIAVPLNYLYRSDELQFVLSDAGCRVVITMSGFADLDYQATLDLMPEPPTVVVFDTDGRARPGTLTLDGLTQLGERNRGASDGRQVDPCGPGDLLYTSGTTGTPKGVITSHDAVLRTAYASALTRAFEDGRRILFSLPSYHMFGYVEGLLSVCYTPAAQSSRSPGSAPNDTSRASNATARRTSSASATMAVAMVESNRFDRGIRPLLPEGDTVRLRAGAHLALDADRRRLRACTRSSPGTA